MYSYHLFLISCASVRSITFLSFIEPIFAWNVPLVSLIFLKRSLVFPFYCFPLFLCIDHWGRLSSLSLLFFRTLHSDGYIFPFLLCFSLLFFSRLFVRPPQTAIFLFCISFSWGWSWSLSPAQCHKPLSIVLQAQWTSFSETHRDWDRTVSECLLWRSGSAVDCCRSRGSGCSRLGCWHKPS